MSCSCYGFACLPVSSAQNSLCLLSRTGKVWAAASQQLLAAVGLKRGWLWTRSQPPGADSCFPDELQVVLHCSVDCPSLSQLWAGIPSPSQGRQDLPEDGQLPVAEVEL